MADTNTHAPGGGSGSLIVRRDGTVVVAEQHASTMLRAPDPAGLAGRDWTSLVAQGDAVTLQAARRALAGGGRWSGTLRFRYGYDEVTLGTTITPVEGSDDLAVIALEATAPTFSPRRPEVASTEDGALQAQVAVNEALHDLDTPSAVARAVLQALHVAVPFDWAAVLRFDGSRSEVVATYPSPMAGIGQHASWPYTTAESALVTSGEPSLDGRVGRETDLSAPLSRLPAYGLASRLLIPLFARAEVAGAVAIYRAGAASFDAQDGFYAERIVRRLGEALQPAPPPPASADAPVEAPRATSSLATAPAPTAPPASEAPPGAPPPALHMPELESLGELVAGVAHELNNPLTSILGYAQILPSLENDDRDHALRTIESESLRAARIVRNLLAFARQRPRERRAVDIETALRRVIDLRRYSLETDDVRVITRFGHVPAVHVDEGQMEQVFLNLINNAHQALRGGGELVISTWVRDGNLYISFADDGPGIPETLRDRVFEPFFTTHDVGAGEGMGLAVVYGVITAHQGRTWVEPSPSGGANFFIELPLDEDDTALASAPAPRPAAVAAPPSPASAPARVLVVDDEASVRSLTQAILGGAGYDVLVASSGAEALDLLSRHHVALVMTDLRMPLMTGMELYQEIRARWPRLAARVLFVTGDIEDEKGGRPAALDEIDYLEKPFTTQDLLRSIRRILAKEG